MDLQEISGQDLPYTNRELREKWHDINGSLQDISNDMTVGFLEVKQRQDLTNGNVKKMQLWRAGLTGAISVLTFLIVPLLLWALSILVNMDSRIQSSVDRALSAYSINEPSK